MCSNDTISEKLLQSNDKTRDSLLQRGKDIVNEKGELERLLSLTPQQIFSIVSLNICF